ncbi:alanine racemase [Thermaurantiacus sp.]
MTPLRLSLDSAALVANWRRLQAMAGVPAAAAVKADGYGLGARGVVDRLHAAGCRTFLVSTFDEAERLGAPGAGAVVLVLHGFTADDAAAAARLPWVRPVLNTPAQVAAWRTAFPGRPADLMVETGMNRLGLDPADVAPALAAIPVDTLHSHLATADQPDHPLAGIQLRRFAELAAATPGVRKSLANSAAIWRGRAFAFDAVRPGLGLYGGLPCPGADALPVVRPEARVLQVRTVEAGEAVGYGATFRPQTRARIATLNLGYADGLDRALGPHLAFTQGERLLPVVGRISMDLVAVDVSAAEVAEGDWLALRFDLAALAAASGLSQYELLVGLSPRFERRWS